VSGVGEQRGQGYGQVLVSPKWLTEESQTLRCVNSDVVAVSSPQREPAGPLFAWAKKQATKSSLAAAAYEQAVSIAGAARGKLSGSQWGTVRRFAREAQFQDGGELLQRVEGFLRTGNRKLTGRHESIVRELKGRSGLEQAMFLEFLASAALRLGKGEEEIRA